MTLPNRMHIPVSRVKVVCLTLPSVVDKWKLRQLDGNSNRNDIAAQIKEGLISVWRGKVGIFGVIFLPCVLVFAVSQTRWPRCSLTLSDASSLLLPHCNATMLIATLIHCRGGRWANLRSIVATIKPNSLKLCRW